MKTKNFKVGTKVKVTYEGTVQSRNVRSTHVSDGVGNWHMYADEADVTIEAAEPKNWPPQAGDIWKVEVEGKTYEFAARMNYAERDKVVLTNLSGSDLLNNNVDSDYYENRFGIFLEWSPTLVRRRDKNN